MERKYKVRVFLGGFAILAACDLILPKLMIPQANAASAQTIPAISTYRSDGARDADTFQQDKTLDAACRKSGQINTVCLCVTHVMKYELSLKEYGAAAQLYGQTTRRETLRKALYADGFKKTEINAAETMENRLIKDIDFAERCANAKAYYKTTRK